MARMQPKGHHLTGKQLRKLRRNHRNNKKEHERRFLIGDIPAHILEGISDWKYATSVMLQVYLGDKAGTRLRGESIVNVLCHTKHKFTRTVKRGEGISRSECENLIKRDVFLEKIKRGIYSLYKTRIFIPTEGKIVELNVFHDRLVGKERVPIMSGDVPYRQIEVESKSLRKLKAFVPPSWFGREITNDPRHSSFAIAQFGAPEEDET